MGAGLWLLCGIARVRTTGLIFFESREGSSAPARRYLVLIRSSAAPNGVYLSLDGRPAFEKSPFLVSLSFVYSTRHHRRLRGGSTRVSRTLHDDTAFWRRCWLRRREVRCGWFGYGQTVCIGPFSPNGLSSLWDPVSGHIQKSKNSFKTLFVRSTGK